MTGTEQSSGPLRLEDLKPGMELEGTVSNIELFGAFVDVGTEKAGLVHISMLAPGTVNRVQDMVEVGQTVNVWVSDVDAAAGRLSLTMIKPVAVKWNTLKPGMQVRGTVERIESYGAFVDIGAERPGLVHVSELSNEYVSDPRDVVKVGEQVDVTVIEVNRQKRQIRLSVKAAMASELIYEDDEEVEELPTAMEIALRSAMEEAQSKQDSPSAAETAAAKAKKARQHQEDLLARTLKQRVRTS